MNMIHQTVLTNIIIIIIDGIWYMMDIYEYIDNITGVTYNGVPNVVYFYELSPSSNTLLNPKSAIFILPL